MDDSAAPDGCELELAGGEPGYRGGGAGELVARVPMSRRGRALPMAFLAFLVVSNAVLAGLAISMAQQPTGGEGLGFELQVLFVSGVLVVLGVSIIGGWPIVRLAAIRSRRCVRVHVEDREIRVRYEPLAWPRTPPVQLPPGVAVHAGGRPSGDEGVVWVGDSKTPELMVERLRSAAHAEWLAAQLRRVL